MTDSKNAHDYGSLLNFIPVGPDGYAIELGPVNKNDEVWWRWSIRRGIYIMKFTSNEAFEARDRAFVSACDWWGNNFKTYWGHSSFIPNSKPSLDVLKSRLADANGVTNHP